MEANETNSQTVTYPAQPSSIGSSPAYPGYPQNDNYCSYVMFALLAVRYRVVTTRLLNALYNFYLNHQIKFKVSAHIT